MHMPGNTNMSENKDFTSNVTSASDNAISDFSLPNKGQPNEPIVNSIIFLLNIIALVIVISEIVAVHILSRCKRVPYQYLRLSISYLLSDMIGAIMFIAYCLWMYGLGLNTELLRNSRDATFGVLHNISSASITAIILERVFALKANLKYTLAMKKIRISLIIVSIWIVHVLLIICVICLSFYQNCNFKWTNCDLWKVNKAAKYASGAIMVTYDVIMILANLVVFRIARRHASQIDAIDSSGIGNSESVSERQYSSLKIIIKLVASNVLLKAPVIAIMLFSSNFNGVRDEITTRVLRSLSYMCIQINSFINLYLYIWKMKECRMLFYFIVAKCFKRYERRAEELRLHVYDIVVTRRS